MIKGIKFKLIIIQSLALIIIVIGVKRLYSAYKSEFYENINDNELLTPITISEIIINTALIGFSFFVLTTLIIGYYNRKNKVRLINTILVFLIVLSLFPIGFFNNGLVHGIINSYCYLFTDNIGVVFFIGGITLTIAGSIILWQTNKATKKELIN